MPQSHDESLPQSEELEWIEIPPNVAQKTMSHEKTTPLPIKPTTGSNHAQPKNLPDVSATIARHVVKASASTCKYAAPKIRS